jgi:hypothetical protein
LPLIVLCPLGSATASAVIFISEGGGSSYNYALAFVLLLCWIFDAVLLYVVGNFLNAAAYLSQSPFSCFLAGSHSLLFIANSILLFFHVLFDAFPSWPNCGLILVHILFSVYLIVQFYSLSFVRLGSTITVLGFLSAEIVSDVVSLVLYIASLSLNGLYPIVIAIVALIGGIGLMYRLCTRKDKVIRMSLAYDGVKNIHEGDHPEKSEITISDLERQERFGLLNLRNRSRCISHLLCGLRNGCDLFIDFSLIKFAVSEFDDTTMLAICLRMMIFFPSEYRQTNVVLREVNKIRSHPVSIRFLIHQVEKIRVIRQSSSSAMATAKLKQMRNAIGECEDYTKSLWAQKKLYYPSFGNLYRDVASASVHCQEVVADFPHSVPHSEAYVEFLVECATDFTAAIGQKNHLDLLQAGRSHAMDYCFKAMVRVYPHYLKQRILDVKGNFIRNKKATGIQSQTSTQSMESTATSTSTGSVELDATLEESLGRMLLNESKTRLAMQAALAEKSLYTMKPLMIYNAFQVLLSLGVAAYGFFGFYSYFNDRVDLMNRGDDVTRCRTNLGGAILTLLMYWGNETGHLDMSGAQAFYTVEDSVGNFVQFNDFFSLQTAKFLVAAQEAWNALEHAITALALKNTDDIYQLFPRIFSEIVPIVQCADSKPLEVTPMNLKSIFAFTYVQAQITSGSNATIWYYDHTNFCFLLTSFSITTDALAGLRESDRSTTTLVAETNTKELTLLQQIVPAAYAVIAFVPFPIVIFFVLRELRQFCTLMETLPIEARRAAVCPIMKQGEDQRKPQGEVQQTRRDSTMIVILVFMTILFAGLVFVTIWVFVTTLDAVVLFEHDNVWSYFVGRAQPQVLEIVIHTFQMLYLKGDMQTYVSNVTRESDRVLELAARADVATSGLLDGSEFGPSILGQDPLVDEIFLMESCNTLDHNDTDFHSTYRCTNLAHLLVVFTSAVRTILDDLDTFNGNINETMPLNVYHLMTRHIFSKITELQEFFSVKVTDIDKKYEQESIILFVAAIVISLSAAILGLMFRNTVSEIFAGGMTFLRRCSPAAVVAHEKLLNYLMDVTEKESLEMTPTQNIIHTAAD